MSGLHRPLLSDGQPVKYAYKAGDRILVRIAVTPTPGGIQNLTKAIKRFTREDVRVLIWDCRFFRLLWEDGVSKEIRSLATTDDIPEQTGHVAVANLDCSVIDLKSGDRLYVDIPQKCMEFRKQRIRNWIGEWAGKEVEIVLQEKVG